MSKCCIHLNNISCKSAEISVNCLELNSFWDLAHSVGCDLQLYKLKVSLSEKGNATTQLKLSTLRVKFDLKSCTPNRMRHETIQIRNLKFSKVS